LVFSIVSVLSIILLLIFPATLNLAAAYPWIPGWLLSALSNIGTLVGIYGVVAGLVATAGLGAAVIPIITSALRKYGLKAGIAY